ncbi:hypothetical protein J2W69_002377 [Rheinheimera soli]|uniref:Uncharacterized protein n=1 Tax=Rheinheimera soli TaxID=443616 RepID=A0ABU1W0D9_9GAMM|nr:hypothetical protein [Rheinheimera soli]
MTNFAKYLRVVVRTVNDITPQGIIFIALLVMLVLALKI